MDKTTDANISVQLQAYLNPVQEDNGVAVNELVLCGDDVTTIMPEYALLGHTRRYAISTVAGGENVYLNIHEPFCFVTVGVQGSGKSHSMSTIMENCALRMNIPNIARIEEPVSTVVLHFDNSDTSMCEAVGLLKTQPELQGILEGQQAAVDPDKAIILVSPSNYRKRRHFYSDKYDVRPLQLDWSCMTGDHIRKLMRLVESDNQLYSHHMMHILREYQMKNAGLPNFRHFTENAIDKCDLRGQGGALKQRLAILELFVAGTTAVVGTDVQGAVEEGKEFIIVDLTDPMLTSSDANGIFQVMVDQFRTAKTRRGKLLVLDEAHRYMSGVSKDGLSDSIVNCARLMRHDGLRLAISTQSPLSLAPELLELVTLAFIHRFHSVDWWRHLNNKLPLDIQQWKEILDLSTGEAIVYASKHTFPDRNLKLKIRKRVTCDLGMTQSNTRLAENSKLKRFHMQ